MNVCGILKLLKLSLFFLVLRKKFKSLIMYYASLFLNSFLLPFISYKVIEDTSMMHL